MPMMSLGPKVPTARTSSPMYEAPVPVTYWWTPVTPWTTARRTSDPQTTRNPYASRSSRNTATGTSTKTWR